MSATDRRIPDVGAWWGEWAGRRPRLVQSLALIALTVMFGYILFRLVQTREGANPVSFVLLFGAEAMSFLATALHFYETWAVPTTPAPEPLDISADIVITTYNEPLTVLEPTIVGSLRAHGVGRVWVLDDGRRDEVREFCEKVGAQYVTRADNAHAKAGNINNALPQVDADYILLLDADHVPSRHVIERMSGYFRDPGVALVQSPHNFRNLDSVQHRTPPVTSRRCSSGSCSLRATATRRRSGAAPPPCYAETPSQRSEEWRRRQCRRTFTRRCGSSSVAIAPATTTRSSPPA